VRVKQHVKTRIKTRANTRDCVERSREEHERYIWLAECEKTSLRQRRFLRPLHKQLLLLGGNVVILWNGHNSVKAARYLRAKGRVFHRRGLKLELGPRSACHENAMAWWRRNQDGAVMTGYALSTDGIWRPHSWGLTVRGTIVETTEKRTIYFGADIRPLLTEMF